MVLRATGKTAQGRRLLFLGVDAAGIVSLMGGTPIVVDGGDLDVAVVYAATMDDMKATCERLGVNTSQEVDSALRMKEGQ